MADRLRREKDIIKRNVDKYIESTTSQYSAYFEGSPSYITYYQLDPDASTQDLTLETVHSLIKQNSPNKYKKINDVVIYGIDALDVMNEINERGLLSTVNGEFVLRPDSIKPAAGDFFVFDYEGMETHLFRINDVQFDKITPKKYYRCQFSLYQNNADEIFDNVEDEYQMDYAGENSSESNIVKKSDAANSEKTQELINGMIDKYEKTFYDEDMDTFIYNDGETGYWSPYLQHFLHETKALTKPDKEFMTEIYIMDINEYDNKNVYNEKVYRNSIFRNIETQNPNVTFEENFLTLQDYDLKSTRNLPFFNSDLNYKLITPINNIDKNNYFNYENSFLLFFDNDKIVPFRDVDHYHKVHIMDDLHIARLEPYINAGDFIYECYRHELEPTKICHAVEVNKNGECYIEIQDASIESLMKSSDKDDDSLYLFYIIRDYLNGNFKISDDILKKLNDYYYEDSVQTYILMPLVIYILKQTLKN